MSRRTKLIITALFLALLAIPAVYAVLTWNPHDPIRVRALPGDHTTPFVGMANQPVLMENTSSIPLRVYFVEGATPGCVALYSGVSRHRRLDWPDSYIPIPPHGTGRVDFYSEHVALESRPPDQVLLAYASATRDVVIRLLNWCYVRSPAFVRRFIPEVHPDYRILPLDPPP
ncbi:MAG: hypothetical protein ACAH88_14320 [Roseimicrobium sp.]